MIEKQVSGIFQISYIPFVFILNRKQLRKSFHLEVHLMIDLTSKVSRCIYVIIKI